MLLLLLHLRAPRVILYIYIYGIITPPCVLQRTQKQEVVRRRRADKARYSSDDKKLSERERRG